MAKKLVIFDFDDTLVDTLGARIPAIIEFCKIEHNLIVSHDNVMSVWGVPFDQMMTELGCSGEIDKTSYLDISKRYPLKAFPEVDGVLARLSRGCSLGILTSLANEVLTQSLSELNWDNGLFKFLYGQEDTPAHKPNPEVFRPVLDNMKLLGVDVRECLYIGDRLSDAHAAIGAGIDFLGVARDEDRAREFSDLNIPFKTDLLEIEREVLLP